MRVRPRSCRWAMRFSTAAFCRSTARSVTLVMAWSANCANLCLAQNILQALQCGGLEEGAPELCLGGASTWSGCRVRTKLWLRLPHGCHRLLSIMPASGAFTVQQLVRCSPLAPASAGSTSVLGSTGLGVHPGQGSLPPRVAMLRAPFGHTWSGFDGALG